jgi:hypothetical protein
MENEAAYYCPAQQQDFADYHYVGRRLGPVLWSRWLGPVPWGRSLGPVPRGPAASQLSVLSSHLNNQ